jgi:oxygen-dependent protoporphyrinogen oxidase
MLAEYDKPVFSPNVRALVFDESDPLSNAGAYGVNDLNVVRYTFSGRTSRQYMSNSADAEALLQLGEASLSKYIPFEPNSRRRFVARRFNQGLCAYTAYHARFIERVGQELKKVAGLYVTGDYIQGASIEACFRSSFACVTQLARNESREVPINATALQLQTQP